MGEDGKRVVQLPCEASHEEKGFRTSDGLLSQELAMALLLHTGTLGALPQTPGQLIKRKYYDGRSRANGLILLLNGG